MSMNHLLSKTPVTMLIPLMLQKLPCHENDPRPTKEGAKKLKFILDTAIKNKVSVNILGTNGELYWSQGETQSQIKRKSPRYFSVLVFRNRTSCFPGTQDPEAEHRDGGQNAFPPVQNEIFSEQLHYLRLTLVQSDLLEGRKAPHRDLDPLSTVLELNQASKPEAQGSFPPSKMTFLFHST